MNVVRWVAWRFMLKGTEKGTFSAMTFFAWLAIGVGIGAMSSLLSVMYGFESTLRDRVLTAYPHLMIKPVDGSSFISKYEPWTETFQKIPGIVRAVPYLESEMIVQSDRRAIGAVVWGVPPQEFVAMGDKLVEGRAPSKKSKLPQLVVGSELSYRLDADVGSQVRIMSPLERTGVMGTMPQSETYEVSGLYKSGHYDFDEQYLFLDLSDAQYLLKKGNSISGWHLWATSADEGQRLKAKVAALLPADWTVQSWTEFNSALFHSLKLEQYSMFTILSFAILIAVMNIVITLMMHANHKRKNIGILRAIGASAGQVRNIFIWQGAFLGGIGLLLGAFLTVVILSYLKFFSTFQLPAFYYDRSIPVEIRPMALVLIYAVAVVLIFLATLYPAQKASTLDPIEAIRE